MWTVPLLLPPFGPVTVPWQSQTFCAVWVHMPELGSVLPLGPVICASP